MRTVKNDRGFTLVEMLLVLVIASSMIVLLLNYSIQKTDELRRDKTVLQVQQLMSAALSYYVNNSAWPSLTTCSTTAAPVPWLSIPTLPNTDTFAPGQGYLVTGFGTNPYGKPYQINCGTQSTSDGGNFYVAMDVGGSTSTNALIIAGKLPMAYVTTPAELAAANFPPKQDPSCPLGPTCTAVVASVTIPGQNLNNARSVNFANLYYSGSCVPAPNCPPGMKASILVIPAGVAGVNDNPTCTGSPLSNDPVTDQCKANLYSMQSFTAFARGGPPNGDPVLPGTSTNFNTSGSGGPYDCNITSGTNKQQSCLQTYANPALGTSNTIITNDGTRYWRVCLAIVTEKGQVAPNNTPATNNYPQWGKMMGQVVAFTRCIPNNGTETPRGSQNVYEPTNNFVP
ncbi:MAG: type II secretion system protein [Gammaproteobacteria bacterium]|nr:type II secretion system protein [Gammaproteobacteria bacterium]